MESTINAVGEVAPDDDERLRHVAADVLTEFGEQNPDALVESFTFNYNDKDGVYKYAITAIRQG